MRKVIIMRGVPGSGKSTWVKQNFPSRPVCSADSFFLDESGSYNYDPKKINEAHQACYRSFLMHLAEGTEVIVVDNTNTQKYEISPYVLAAETFGYEVQIIRIECRPQVAAGRNVHAVPEAAVLKMAHYFEEPLPWWNEVRV